MKEFVEKLREKADTFEKSGCAVDGIVKDYRKSADMIEKLCEKSNIYGFVEKLIERLEEEQNEAKNLWDNSEFYTGAAHAFEIAIQFVNQLAEEQSNVPDTNVGKWIPCSERLPDTTDYILLSFSNFTIPLVGRWEEDEDGGAFYVGDDTESCLSSGVFVNAWQELPKVYCPGKEKNCAKDARTRFECIRSMNEEELADKILASEVSTMLDFCQDFSKCNELIEKGEEIPDEMCKKCLVKWLNYVEQQKTIPKEHFEERFNRVN